MTDDHQLHRWWVQCARWSRSQTLLYSLQDGLFGLLLRPQATGSNRFVAANHFECICAAACMHLFDVDWWRAVTHRKEVVTMHCPHSVRCLQCCLFVRFKACVCVWRMCVLALDGNDFEKRGNTPNSQYHPISPHWNQHGCVFIGGNVSLLQVLSFFWHWLVSY